MKGFITTVILFFSAIARADSNIHITELSLALTDREQSNRKHYSAIQLINGQIGSIRVDTDQQQRSIITISSRLLSDKERSLMNIDEELIELTIRYNKINNTTGASTPFDSKIIVYPGIDAELYTTSSSGNAPIQLLINAVNRTISSNDPLLHALNN